MIACFIGHRNAKNTQELQTHIQNVVIDLVNSGVDTFLFGSRSAFNDMCLNALNNLKSQYKNVKTVYVRAEYQHIDNSYTKYLKQRYDETYFPAKLERAGKSVYVERNQHLIDLADVCVFYYDCNYQPPLIHRQRLASKQTTSGTQLAYAYALKQQKQIINLYK